MQNPAVSSSRRQTTTENLRQSSRRVLVMGPSGSGKSTLSASASRLVGDVLPLATPVIAKDVAVLQGDTEGMAGARAVGIEIPNIFDYTRCETWDAYEKQLMADLTELRPEVLRGDIKVLIVDLALPNFLAVKKIAPKTISDWTPVRVLGHQFFKAFDALPGCTVVVNAQIRANESAIETPQAVAASAAKTVGGERTMFGADLYKGMGQIWTEHCSLILTTERKPVRQGVGKDAQWVVEGCIYTQSNKKYEGKSRFGELLSPVEPFTCTLNALLRKAYGDAL